MKIEKWFVGVPMSQKHSGRIVSTGEENHEKLMKENMNSFSPCSVVLVVNSLGQEQKFGIYQE